MNKDSEALSRTEIDRRRDDALRRALATPPKPKRESVKRKEQGKKEKPSD